ncbi:hypothetical protein TcBrA4_0075890 [Trypanosoma cruzi]|nr:hypothetical protein TcBrA4_0075890 [Trypanosoma cruzi]
MFACSHTGRQTTLNYPLLGGISRALAHNGAAVGGSFSTRCAYQCWQQDYEQVKLAFDNLVECIGVLEGWQDPIDELMDFGRSLLNTFRMQLTIASDPASGFPNCAPSTHRCSPDRHLCEGSPTSRGSARNPTQLCDANNVIPMDTRHLHAMCAERELITIQASIKKRQRGCRTRS